MPDNVVVLGVALVGVLCVLGVFGALAVARAAVALPGKKRWGAEAPPDAATEAADGLGEDLQTSMACLPDAVMVLNAQLEINWANRVAADWFGFEFDPHERAEGPSSTTRRRLSSLLRGTTLGAYLKAGDYGKSFDCSAPGAPGVDLRVRIVPFRHGQFLLQARDVTRIKNLEMVRRDFVANASHELRTPVSILYGYLDMMTGRDADIDAQWRPAIRQMHEQTRRIKQIIDDMMTLSRLEQADSPPHEYLAMAPLLESAWRDAVALSGRRKHRITTTIDANYSLYCNPQEIESLVANLLSNAVRYTPAKGDIAIRWNVDLTGGTLSVRDNGMGIDPADVPRLTERFYRTDPARSRETGGTGLGLAIVNHVVNRHQANLLIESRPGKGSRFVVHFPAERIQKHHAQVNLLLN